MHRGMSEPSTERYGFTWSGKQASLEPLSETRHGAAGRRCRTQHRSPEPAENVFVEGDNLEVLKLLRRSSGRRSSSIYTDPPYNTKQSFVYDDDFSTKQALALPTCTTKTAGTPAGCR